MDGRKVLFECALCDTKTKHVVNNKVKNTSEYNETEVWLNNGSTMRVAVCSEHTEPTEEDYSEIMKKMRIGWMEEIATGYGNKDWYDKIGKSLIITGIK